MSKKFIIIPIILFVGLLFITSPVWAEEFQPGDIITFTIEYTNEGNNQAVDIAITNPIPEGTTYLLGTLVIDAVSQTDAKDADGGDYNETVIGAVYFYIPSVPDGGSGEVSFQVQVDEGWQGNIENQASVEYKDPESEESETLVLLPEEGGEGECIPNWQCTDWSECVDDQQTRTCTDLNNCGTEKPAESQVCGAICTPDWQCTDWSECVEKNQTRTCLDLNYCGTEEGKPDESQTCEEEEVCTPDWKCGLWSECIEGVQTRTCWDANECDTEEGKPAQSRTCELVCVPNWQCGPWAECIDELQARTCWDVNECDAEEGKPLLSRDCPMFCIPDWQCDDWSECIEGYQERTCQDFEGCDTDEGKPNEFKACGEVCLPTWQCTDWSECIDKEQTRTCQDLNECDIDENKPILIRACGERPIVDIAAFLEGINDQFRALAAFHQQILENEPLQKINKRAVLPAVSVAVVANTLASVPLAAAGWPLFQYLFQLLRFLFTEPSYLFARRRRYWGTVYNALSKQPIGLAVIRLYNVADKKLVATRVTGPDGRYFFIVEAGKEYFLEVKAPGFTFPSGYLQGKSEDGTFGKLYFGGSIKFSQDERPFIGSNIPLDAKKGEVYITPFAKPVKTKIVDLTSFLGLSREERKKEDKKILAAFSKKRASAVFAHLGPVLAFVCLILSPTLYTFILFLAHIIFLLLFRHLARSKGANPWGEVYDRKSEERLARAIVRLFDTQYGKLLLSNVTEKSGRYGFLVGNDKYILTCEKDQYRLPEEKVEIQGQKEGMVRKNLGMEKK